MEQLISSDGSTFSSVHTARLRHQAMLGLRGDILSGVNNEDRALFQEIIPKILDENSPDYDRKGDVIRLMFTPHSKLVLETKEALRLSDADISSTISTSEAHELFSVFLRYPLNFSYQINFFLEYSTNPETGREAERMLQPSNSGSDARFSTQNIKSGLCFASETKMVTALDKKKTILLTDENGKGIAVIKFTNKFSALTLQNFISGDRIIPAGLWVAPKDTKIIEELFTAFDDSRASLSFRDLPSGDWNIYRSVDETNHTEFVDQGMVFFDEVLKRAEFSGQEKFHRNESGKVLSRHGQKKYRKKHTKLFVK